MSENKEGTAIITPVAKVQLGEYEAELREDDLKTVKRLSENDYLIDFVVKSVLRFCTDCPERLDEHAKDMLNSITCMISIKDDIERLGKIKIDRKETRR